MIFYMRVPVIHCASDTIYAPKSDSVLFTPVAYAAKRYRYQILSPLQSISLFLSALLSQQQSMSPVIAAYSQTTAGGVIKRQTQPQL